MFVGEISVKEALKWDTSPPPPPPHAVLVDLKLGHRTCLKLETFGVGVTYMYVGLTCKYFLIRILVLSIFHQLTSFINCLHFHSYMFRSQYIYHLVHAVCLGIKVNCVCVCVRACVRACVCVCVCVYYNLTLLFQVDDL